MLSSSGQQNPVSSEDEDEKLDFQEAMADFKDMFPTMSAVTIERILRENEGAVDETIDQLLTMSMEDFDETESSTTQPKLSSTEKRLSHQQAESMESPPDYFTTIMNSKNPDWSGFSAPANTEKSPGPIRHIPDPDSISHDLVAILQKSPRGGQPAGAQYNSSINKQMDINRPVNKQSKYKPPLVGRLPDDFLRITPVNFGKEVRFDEAKLRKQKRSDQKYATMPMGATLGIFSTSAPTPYYHQHQQRKKHHKGLEHAHTTTGLSPRRRKQYEETRKQAEHLKDMMLENKFQRQAATDPDLSNYLEDERIAIMLQNREFMKQLRRNKDFIRALDRDTEMMREEKDVEKLLKKNSTSAKKSPVNSSTLRQMTAPEASNSTPELKVPEGPPIYDLRESNSSHSSKKIAASSSITENPEPSDTGTGAEGYGADSMGMCNEFGPYTKKLDTEESNEVAFKDRLLNMGKSSRQKFALMARKFIRRQKGAKGILGTSDSHYSGALLLEEDSGSGASNEELPAVTEKEYNYNQ